MRKAQCLGCEMLDMTIGSRTHVRTYIHTQVRTSGFRKGNSSLRQACTSQHRALLSLRQKTCTLNPQLMWVWVGVRYACRHLKRQRWHGSCSVGKGARLLHRHKTGTRTEEIHSSNGRWCFARTVKQTRTGGHTHTHIYTQTQTHRSHM